MCIARGISTPRLRRSEHRVAPRLQKAPHHLTFTLYSGTGSAPRPGARRRANIFPSDVVGQTVRRV